MNAFLEFTVDAIRRMVRSNANPFLFYIPELESDDYVSSLKEMHGELMNTIDRPVNDVSFATPDDVKQLFLTRIHEALTNWLAHDNQIVRGTARMVLDNVSIRLQAR